MSVGPERQVNVREGSSITDSQETNATRTTLGEYRLVKEIGHGGMGTVYRALDRNGSVVAVKVLASHLTDNEVLRQRFFQEGRLAMRLDHPNLVRALDVGEDQGRCFFTMEYVAGENLAARIKRLGRLEEREALHIILEVARGLDRAHHEGLVHRDVKPENVLLTPDGHAKLTDLGLVKAIETDQRLTQADKGLGTPSFMSPEQFKDARTADVRSDVYSLGETLYMMVTGIEPFPSGKGLVDTYHKKLRHEYTPPEEMVPTLREATSRTIKVAMHANPARRPPSVRAFVRMLAGKSVSLLEPEERDESSAVTKPTDFRLPVEAARISDADALGDLAGPPEAHLSAAVEEDNEPEIKATCTAIAEEWEQLPERWIDLALPYVASIVPLLIALFVYLLFFRSASS